MRNAIMAITFALTLTTGSVDAQKKKTPKPDVGPERIAWFDITTTNLR